MTEAPDDNSPCESCGHSWDQHKLATTAEPPTYGWLVCPTVDCYCYSTWSLDKARSSAEVEAEVQAMLAEVGITRNDLCKMAWE